jgi:hypothetical protein
MILALAADEIAGWPQWRTDRDFRHGAGGDVFNLLIEFGGRHYGGQAVHLLEAHLRRQLAHGQLQHWRETDPAGVVATLRELGREQPVDPFDGLTPCPDADGDPEGCDVDDDGRAHGVHHVLVDDVAWVRECDLPTEHRGGGAS